MFKIRGVEGPEHSPSALQVPVEEEKLNWSSGPALRGGRAGTGLGWAGLGGAGLGEAWPGRTDPRRIPRRARPARCSTT